MSSRAHRISWSQPLCLSNVGLKFDDCFSILRILLLGLGHILRQVVIALTLGRSLLLKDVRIICMKLMHACVYNWIKERHNKGQVIWLGDVKIIILFCHTCDQENARDFFRCTPSMLTPQSLLALLDHGVLPFLRVHCTTRNQSFYPSW
jgi:hypothetical protein